MAPAPAKTAASDPPPPPSLASATPEGARGEHTATNAGQASAVRKRLDESRLRRCAHQTTGDKLARSREIGLLSLPVPSHPSRQENEIMAESVYKVIELVGTSTESWEKAAAAA